MITSRFLMIKILGNREVILKLKKGPPVLMFLYSGFYLPLNAALRFSTKAPMPSRWSSVANSTPNRDAS
jgi:hypothetical protein